MKYDHDAAEGRGRVYAIIIIFICATVLPIHR